MQRARKRTFLGIFLRSALAAILARKIENSFSTRGDGRA
jgi:hypothetical protein